MGNLDIDVLCTDNRYFLSYLFHTEREPQLCKKDIFMAMLSGDGLAVYKLVLSQKRMYSVGVPQAVDVLLSSERYEGMSKDPEFTSGELRKRLILDYFKPDAQEPLVAMIPRPCLRDQPMWVSDENLQAKLDRESRFSKAKTTRLLGDICRFMAQMDGRNPLDILPPKMIADPDGTQIPNFYASTEMSRYAAKYCEWYNIVGLKEQITSMALEQMRDRN